MDNPVFVDGEDIPMVHQDEDFDEYNSPNTSRVDETKFTVPDTAETASMLRLRQKVKRDKLSALYRHLNVTGNIDLIKFDRLRLTKDPKKEPQFLSFTTVIDGFL